MSIVKSDLINELADAYPNFLRKDIIRLVDISLSEIQNALKRGERVELRDIFTSSDDYANPIEPSHIGGEKLAQSIVRWIWST